jgi:hypothetical protein
LEHIIISLIAILAVVIDAHRHYMGLYLWTGLVASTHNVTCVLKKKKKEQKRRDHHTPPTHSQPSTIKTAAMSIRLINTSREVIEFPTVQEAYDFVLTLDTPMAFRTDAPDPVCIPIDPESSPSQLSLRTYAILRTSILSSC